MFACLHRCGAPQLAGAWRMLACTAVGEDGFSQLSHFAGRLPLASSMMHRLAISWFPPTRLAALFVCRILYLASSLRPLASGLARSLAHAVRVPRSATSPSSRRRISRSCSTRCGARCRTFACTRAAAVVLTVVRPVLSLLSCVSCAPSAPFVHRGPHVCRTHSASLECTHACTLAAVPYRSLSVRALSFTLWRRVCACPCVCVCCLAGAAAAER